MQNKPKFANFASDTKKSSEDEKKEFANSIIFNNLMGEGEKYLRDSLYDKSIKSYTKALEIYPGHKTALAERAVAYFKKGEHENALVDANESLKDNKEYLKALYIKAEALYAIGEFETALVFFYRCKRIRSDQIEYQIGINKATEAIESAVGDPETVKLSLNGDLSVFKEIKKIEEDPEETTHKNSILSKKQEIEKKKEKRLSKNDKPKTVKELLGELYADKIFLEKILDDDSKKNEKKSALTKQGNVQKNKSVSPLVELANDGLEYLDSRTEFWRQVKPSFRKKKQNQEVKKDLSKTALNHITKTLEAIESLLANGKYLEALEKSKKLLEFIEPLSKEKVSEKDELKSTINSNIGNAYLEMNKYEQAIKAHQKDLEISTSIDNQEGISRAYENIGRVYARSGKFKEALDIWNKKLPLVESEMEKAWLYHEIGHCYLELKKYEESKEYGMKSLDSAEKISEELWRLNATVLIAQSEVKMGSIENIKSAIVNFEKAKKLTEEQNDVKAGNAIKKALEDCKKKLKKLEEEQEEKQAQEEDLPIEEKSKTPEITAREKKSEEPESIVKTEPQTPTEPVKQMIPSDSDQPIRKETPIEIVSTTKTDEAKSSQKQQVESKPEPI